MLSKKLFLKDLKGIVTLALIFTTSCFLTQRAASVPAGVENYEPLFSLAPPEPPVNWPLRKTTSAYYDLNITQLYSTSFFYKYADSTLPFKLISGNQVITINSAEAEHIKQLFPQYYTIIVKYTVEDNATGICQDEIMSQPCEWPDVSPQRIPWNH